MKQIENTKWMDTPSGKCANCGKAFYKRSTEWGYAYRGKECCTYSCMRQLERKDPESRVRIKEAEERRLEELRKEYQSQPHTPEPEPEPETAPSQHFMTDEEREKICRLWKAGNDTGTIERKTGRSGTAIRKVLKEEGLRIPVRRGNGRRVTEELRKRMIKLRGQGLTYKQIGQKVGYSEWTVAVNIKK